MQGTIGLGKAQLLAGAVGHGLVIVSILALACLGQVVPEQAGWVLGGPGTAMVQRRRSCARVSWEPASGGQAELWLQLAQTWQVALLRSLLLWGLWHGSGPLGPAWLALWPWALWLWRSLGLAWPGLGRRPSWYHVEHWLAQGQRWLTLGYGGLVLALWLRAGWGVAVPAVRAHAAAMAPLLGTGCLVCGSTEPRVTVERQADGSYQATLCGHFTLQVAGDSLFRRRLLLLFLGLLERPGPPRKGRRTRDGRTPFVTERQLAVWFGTPQPVVSRWYRYWLHADWANLLACTAPKC